MSIIKEIEHSLIILLISCFFLCFPFFFFAISGGKVQKAFIVNTIIL